MGVRTWHDAHEEYDMTITEEFTKYFDEQYANGLVDMKISVAENSKGTAEDAMAEILDAERLIAAGEVEEHLPEQITECSPAAAHIICSCVAGVPIDQDYLDTL